MNDKSPLILGTSATLLGICFIVLTSRQIMSVREATIVDELTAIALVIFMASCVLSFLSMRTVTVRAKRFERIADVSFVIGLFFLFAITMLITFNIIA